MHQTKITATPGTPVILSMLTMFPYDRPFTVVNVEVVPIGSCLVETTLSAPDANTGLFTNATWTAWASGSVSAKTRDHLNAPVTAIRLTAIGGSAEMKVVA
jgi:hypothetical protein